MRIPVIPYTQSGVFGRGVGGRVAADALRLTREVTSFACDRCGQESAVGTQGCRRNLTGCIVADAGSVVLGVADEHGFSRVGGRCLLSAHGLAVELDAVGLLQRRSRMASAMVGSPRASCQWATGSWLVMMVERAAGPR